MSDDLRVSATPRPSRISRRHTGMVLASSLLGAASNFIIMFIAARSLSVGANADFLLFWSLMQGLFSVLSGVQNEMTRAVGSVTLSSAPGRARVLGVEVTVGVGVGLLLLALGPVLATRVLTHGGWYAVITLAATAVVYAVYIGTVGSLAGIHAWGTFAGFLSTEVVGRIATVVTAAIALGSVWAIEAACAGAILLPLLWILFSRDAREALGARADVPFSRLVRNVSLAALSTACTALVLTAFPPILKLTHPGASATLLGALILAIQLTRAPIMMPLTNFQSVAISAFMRHRDRPLQAVARPVGMLLLLGAFGAAAAYVVGPWFLPLFTPEYDMVPGWAFSVLVLSGALIGTLTLLGAMALSAGRHVLYVFGWLSATAVVICVLLSPLPTLGATALALTSGPLLGCVLLLTVLSTSGGRSHATTPIPSPSAASGTPPA